MYSFSILAGLSGSWRIPVVEHSHSAFAWIVDDCVRNMPHCAWSPTIAAKRWRRYSSWVDESVSISWMANVVLLWRQVRAACIVFLHAILCFRSNCRGYKAGETWYLISGKWWQSWMKYSKYNVGALFLQLFLYSTRHFIKAFFCGTLDVMAFYQRWDLVCFHVMFRGKPLSMSIVMLGRKFF